MRIFAITLLVPLVLANPISSPATSPEDVQSTLAPLSTTGDHIEDSYIVVFKQGINLDQIALHLSGVEQAHGADVSENNIHLLSISCP